MRIIPYILLCLVCAVSSAQTSNRINYDESKVPDYVLPEILVSNSGKKIRTVKDWENIRRPEILDFFYNEVYGITPRSDSITTSWELLSEDRDALDGKATFRQVLFTFSNGERSLEAILLLILPNNYARKVPVIISYNFNGNHSICSDPRIYYPPLFRMVKSQEDPAWGRGNQSSRWSLDRIVGRGYAIATMCYHDICPDSAALREYSIGSLFPGFHRRMQDHNEWGAIGMWAWGSSRIADYLETEDRIDSERMAIMGHSRLGKAAIWAGVQDKRFKVVISNDSGCCGAALSKRVYGENLSWITSYLGHWFCPSFRQYAGNEASLPFDQHQLLATIAPRHLYIASASDDKWADPKGEYLAAFHAGEVYRLYGMEGLPDCGMPSEHSPVHNDIAYHIRAGKHDVTDYDWQCYLDYCDKYLKTETADVQSAARRGAEMTACIDKECNPAVRNNTGTDPRMRTWRSALYPEDWQPGYADSEGRSLPDFSYAGYHSGLVPVPEVTENVIDVTKAPYRIDNSGKKDITARLQKAIDHLSENGGGVIYLPEGTYLMSVPEDRGYGVKVSSDSIVIRGAGADKTFILNTSTYMRGKTLFSFRAEEASWDKPAGKEVRLASDIYAPAAAIPVEDAGEFAEGDLVIIKSDVTPGFRMEHKVGTEWDELTKGVHFIRTVTGIDTAEGIVHIDVPTRYFLKTRDNARIYRINRQLSECGIEDLSFGNIQHPEPEGWGEEDYRTEGNGSYYVHGSHMLEFRNAENCWARRLATFHPEGNDPEVHILSNCLLIYDSRFITVEKCDFQRSQAEGGGGNGYMYTMWGNDCMIKDCHAEDGRHNYDFKGMSASGNVILRCTSKDAYKATDFHMHLSMANLIDCFTADGDCIDAGFRPYGSSKQRHMYSTTESVIWNTTGIKEHDKGYLVRSLQFGNGYVIGTSGEFHNVITGPVSGTMNGIPYDTAPIDWTEGIGTGKYLYPQSLYEDQFSRRINRIRIAE